MRSTFLISSKLLKSQTGSFSKSVTIIATASIAFGIAILLVSYSVLQGFNTQIKKKLFSFTGHIELTKAGTGTSLEDPPLGLNTEIYKNWNGIENVEALQIYIRKSAIMKTNEGVHGVVLKGVQEYFHISSFQENIKEGNFLDFENDSLVEKKVLISKIMSDRMRVGLNDSFLLYFVDKNPIFRKVKIVGLYETGMEEIDQRFIMCHADLIRGVNKWNDSLAGGYELYLKDFEMLDVTEDEVFEKMDNNLAMYTVKGRYAQIFDWFNLLNKNVQLLMFFVFLVVCVNVATSFTIIILDRAKFIGILKALGTANHQLKEIFIYNGFKIALRGLLFGNLLAFVIIFFQWKFRVIPLDAANYYINYVPISWDWENFIFSNMVLFAVVSVSLFLPLYIINRLSIVNAIRFV